MSTLKKLAGQTIWYGTSTIFGRFLNYLLTPILTTIYASDKYGQISIAYAYVTFLNILFTYGMETAYFRFVRDEDPKKVYNTAFISLLCSTLVLIPIMILFSAPLAVLWKDPGHPEYVIWFAFIIAFDTLAVLPFARLRYHERPRKFAFIKIMNILINVISVIFFLILCPKIAAHHPHSLLLVFYNPAIGIGYVFISLLIAAAATLLLLSSELISINLHFDFSVWKRMIAYSLPLLIVGFGGMINETLDRAMLPHLLPASDEVQKSETGIYSANYKLSILITLFIQAFRMGAEPFFFRYSQNENAKLTYARVLKFFVMVCCIMFLIVVLFLGIWKYFIGVKAHPEYEQGLRVVPILLMANLCLGIYYNLAIWYKLINKTMIGAYITIAGAIITIVLNIIWIPTLSYVGCAWATLICYAFMMLSSYLLGQKYYPIPYNWQRISTYIISALAIYFVFRLIKGYITATPYQLLTGIGLIIIYCLFLMVLERKEFSKLPFVGKYFVT